MTTPAEVLRYARSLVDDEWDANDALYETCYNGDVFKDIDDPMNAMNDAAQFLFMVHPVEWWESYQEESDVLAAFDRAIALAEEE